MTSPLPPARKWLEQARADLAVCQIEDPRLAQCHRRYFVQQAYEKALKGFLVAQISESRREVLLILRDTIFRSHSPLTDFPAGADLEDLRRKLTRDFPDHCKEGLKQITLVRRQGHALVRNRHGRKILYQLDATRQSIVAERPSYRYPFFDEGQPVSPSRWQGWSTYQGTWDEVLDAVRELMDSAAKSIALAGRNRLR